MSSRFLAASLAALILASSVFANAAPPPRPVVLKSSDVKIVVHIDANAKKPVLRIPADLVGLKKEEPKREGSVLLNNPATVIAGLALAGAFVTGGFWLLRGRGGRTAAALLCLGCLALAGGTAFADLALPKPPPGPTEIGLPANIPLTADVTLQIMGNPPFGRRLGNVIELVIPAPKPVPKPEPKPNEKSGE